MVIKVYVAMISCSQEVKKNQQRAVMILESKNIPYTITDITDPACEDSKDYMVETATPKEGSKIPVTPQIYNEADYCGDFDGLDMANECDTLGDFLKLSEEEKKSIKIGITGIIPKDKKETSESHITNGVSTSREGSPAKAPDSAAVVEAESIKETPPVENAAPKEENAAPPVEVAPPEVKEKVEEKAAVDGATEKPASEPVKVAPKVEAKLDDDDESEEDSEEDSSEEDSEDD